ncbi:MAG TPA: LIC_13355 family lipoprotein [Leptospiraceae bacterium]|nr:LIC_13355 family lipoprotein [Leptospiraceae bacterium]HMW04998.1 LIC_13355 family lipoprotein [Leptospiraceae bacterium]HMX35096.1 LIC_13355 family lipoprotein [Leptospiraceae bacterium]HMY30781.1 LIC_13355 family lipoprotein [Leptospiraceae bacterium]HMZ66362.1 LIC_13355 family lipoprotein [Leptospiraceae bacterium]
MYQTIIVLASLISLINCSTNKSSKGNSLLAAALLLSNSRASTSVSSQVTIPADTADTVTSAPGDTGSGFQDKTKAINGVRGGGFSTGSTDVFSLTSTGSSASIVLEWKGKRVLNGSGIDFIVFENPFQYNGNASSIFMEPIIVEVSQDNISYCGFSPDYTFSPETTYSTNPTYWKRFAGITPVLYNVETNPLSGNDLYDITKTGGDGFDLDNLSGANDFNIGCSTTLRDKIKSEGFVYLRLISATARTNADTGSNFLQDTGAFGGGPDIDGVIARYRATR